jgi:hypothetical protein
MEIVIGLAVIAAFCLFHAWLGPYLTRTRPPDELRAATDPTNSYGPTQVEAILIRTAVHYARRYLWCGLFFLLAALVAEFIVTTS